MTTPTVGPDAEDILTLATIIREVFGGDQLPRVLARALAEAILSHPDSRWLPATPSTSTAVEPPGCPIPGACSCPVERSPDAGLVRLLHRAEAELPAAHSLAGQIRLALEGWGVSAAPATSTTIDPLAPPVYGLYDPEGEGITFYKTKEELEKHAKDVIESYFDDGEWYDGLNCILGFEVTHRVSQVDRKDRPITDEDNLDKDGEYWLPGIDYKCNYIFAKIESQPGLSTVAPLLWVLWNHQGGHSPVGQAIRKYLGMGQFENMTLKQVEAAKKYKEQLFSAPPSHQEAFDTALANAMMEDEVIEKLDQLSSDINSLRQMINLPPGVRPATYKGVINGKKITIWNDKENEFYVSDCHLNLANDGTWRSTYQAKSGEFGKHFRFSSLSEAWNTALKSLETNHDPN